MINAMREALGKRFARLLLGASLAACSSLGLGGPPPLSPANGNNLREFLYVASGDSVYEYPLGSKQSERTIRGQVVTMAFDRDGNLCLVEPGGGPQSIPSSIKVYAPGSIKPLRTIQHGVSQPSSIAFDASGNLYVANSGFSSSPSITVYAPGGTTPVRTLSHGFGGADSVVPDGLLFDSSGNLYVEEFNIYNVGWISVYRPGASAPYRRIRAGLHGPGYMTFDTAGNLYVANPGYGDGKTIAVYAPGARVPFREITEVAPVF